MVSYDYAGMTDGIISTETYTAYFSAASMPASLGLQFDSAPIINAARFHSYNTAARPRYFRVEYSDDGSNWTKVPATGWTGGLLNTTPMRLKLQMRMHGKA